MANSLYDKGRQKFLDGSISWSSDTIKLVLCDLNTYTPSLSADEFLSDITSGARVATSSALGSKSSTAGVANAATVILTSVTGVVCAAAALYKDTGSASTSPLIGLIDTATGLPVTPNGGDITFTWDTGANKIFKLMERMSEEEKARWINGGFWQRVFESMFGERLGVPVLA